MRIFLTGGAGYIGSAAAERLLAAGHQVTVFDSLVTGHRQAVPEGAQFIQADLSDRQALFDALRAQEYAAVMHFAAFIEAGESMREPGKYFQNNAVNSLWLLEACVQAGVRRFVYSSSAAVYASSDDPLTEEAPMRPSNIYGQTKLMTETLLEWYREARGLGYAALRYFNAAGGLPDRGEAHQPETHLIPLVLQVALGQRPGVQLFGTDYPTPDGTCVRDYVHVSDVISAHSLALEALEPEAGLVYNVGSGTGFSVRQVIDTARRVTGHPLPAEDAPRRPGDPPRLVANSDKIRRELGWSPEHPALQDTIASAWEWHRTHPSGYGR
ncbi:MAG: UDP-glucose 4-epimerase GalE [Anaerolineales bacterium]